MKDNCDHAGILEFDEDLVSFQIGENVKSEEISNFGERVEWLGDKLFLVDFINFQYGILKENYNPHKPVINSLKKHGIFSRVSQGLPKASGSLVDKDKYKEQDKEQDKGKEKEKDKNKKASLSDAEQERILSLLEFWNSKNIIQHRASDRTISAIARSLKKKLKIYSLDDIKQAIENYALTTNSEATYFDHKWSLSEFLSRSGGEQFFCESFIFENYLDKKRFNGSNAISTAQAKQDRILSMLEDNPYAD